MPVTKVGIIYSVALSHCRRIVVPSSDDSEIDAHSKNIIAGEAILFIPIDEYQKKSEDEINEYIALVTGNQTLNDHCAVIDDDGKIAAVLCGDPSIDNIEGKNLVLLEKAVVGGTYVDGVYTPPEEV